MKSALASRRATRRRSTLPGNQNLPAPVRRQGGKYPGFRLSPLAIALGAAMGLPVAYGQQIVIDGRTATNLAISGNVTNVTTSTRVGNNAFNSFRKFDVYSGNTVNLHVPNGASNLLNLISSASASRIDGMLNAIKNGQIGGNVFLANPEGVIVGAAGVINTGSLTLLTPSHAFVDGFFDATGMPNAGAVSQVLAGTVPINPNGLIRVQGKINVTGDATLRGGNVGVDGAIQSGALFTNTQVDFSDVVNTTDIKTGSAVIVQNGKIQIVAANDIAIGGTVATNGGGNLAAGLIEIRAGHDLQLNDGALVTASGRGGNSAGGSILLWADNDTTTRMGSAVRADGGLSGDAGAMEISARKRLVLSGGAFSAVANNGRDGSILLDPENIVIDFDMLRGVAGVVPDGATWDAGSLTLDATDTITLTSGHILSTRQVTVGGSQTARDAHISNDSTGDSGSVTISAHKVILESGSQILANATAGHAAGDITITATDTADDPFFGSLDDQSAGIDIHGATLKGRAITLSAVANDIYDWGVDSKIGSYLLKQLENLAYTIDASLSEAKAHVVLDQGASIVADGDVKITSKASADASMRVISPNGFGAGYGKATASATTEVLDASITSKGNVVITSDSSAATDVIVNTINTGKTNSLLLDASKYIDLAVAISEADLDSTAKVGGAGTISATGGVTVKAMGKKTSNSSANGGAYDDGTFGVGIAFSSYTADVTAAMDGTIQKASAVEVSSDLTTAGANNSIAANSGSGSGNATIGTLKALTPNALISSGVAKVQSALLSALGSNASSPATGKDIGLAASFLYLEQVNNVEARIGSQAKVNAEGAVTLNATSEDVLTYRAAASVDKAVYDDAKSGKSSAVKEVALSAAIAIVDLENHTRAYIGDHATVDAGGAITVNAHSDVPVPLQAWGDWGGVNGIEDGAVRLADLLTSATFTTVTGWTQAFVESKSFGMSGSFNVFDLENTAEASIGDFVRINTGRAITSASDVSVAARATQGTINLAGVFGFKFWGGSNQGAGVGGALASMNFVDSARATIGRGAIVNANDLTVVALSESNNITIAEAGGKSASSLALDASFALVDVSNTTEALIDNSALVSTSGFLDLRAEDATRNITIAGGFSKGSNAVGVAVAIDDIERTTRAAFITTTAVLPAIASLDGLDVTGALLVLPAGTTFRAGQAVVYKAGAGGPIDGLTDGGIYYVIVPDPAKPGEIRLATSAADASAGIAIAVLDSPVGSGHRLTSTTLVQSTGAVSLNARTSGFLSSTAVAGSFAEDSKSKDATPPEGEDETDAEYKARQEKVAEHGAKMAARWGVSLSGAASIADVREVTEAGLTGTRVDGAATLNVSASNSSDLYTGGGAFAISTSDGKVPGIAGSYSHNSTSNQTRAFVSNAVVGVTGAVTVSADTSDSSMISVTASLGYSSKHAGLAGAVSINSIDNETSAFIDGGSVVKGLSASVTAEDGASIFALAGTIDVAGKNGAGFGGSLAMNEIGNTTDAHVKDSDLEATGQGIVIAQRADQDIQSIAVSAGGSQGGLAANFGISINEISSTDIAYVSGKKTDGLKSVGDIKVTAADESSIQSYAAGLSISTQSSAGGGAGAYNAIDNDVSAYLESTKARSTTGSLVVAANTDDDIFSFAAGAAGGQSLGLAGSASVNRIDTGTQAWLTNVDAQVDDSVAVTANADFEFDAWGGALGAGGTAGFGGTVGVNLMYGDTSAWIGGASKVDANGNAAVEVPAQDADGKRDAFGVAVAARTTQHAESWLVSGGFSSSFGIGLTGSGNEATSQTTAYIAGDAEINSRNQLTANAGQSVSVEAFSDTRYIGRLGSIAGSGGTAIGATAAVNLINTGTRAYIDDAKIYARDDISVIANAKESLEAAGVTAGLGGDVGLAGTVFVTLIDATSEAYIRNADTIKAGGDVDVKATDRVEIGGDDTGGLLGGAMAVSGGVAVGAAVSTVSIGNTTRAYMTDVKSDAAGITTVKAAASHELHTGLLGISAGPAVAVSASVVVTDIATATTAYISQTKAGGTVINADTASAGAGQDVLVGADSATEVNSNIFSAGAAVANGGASVDVTSIRNDVSAVIGAGVEAHAKHDVGVTVDSRHAVDSLVVAFGGGVGVAQGAVSIANIGSSMSDYSSGQSADASSTSAGQSADAKNMMGFEGKGSYQPAGAFDKSATPGGTTALIGAGARITAGNNISVAASNSIEVDLVPGAGTASIGAIGAGIGLASLKPQVTAKVENNAELNAGALIDVGADAKVFGSNVDAYAAGVGAAVISAAVAIIDSDANVEASLGDSVKITDADSVKVHAGRFNEQRAEAWGLSLGGAGAIGASVAESNSSGTTKAHVGSSADLSKAGALEIIAKNTVGSSYGNSAYAVAGAGGGLVGASGAEARAISSGDIFATTGTGVKLPTGDVTLSATRQSHQHAETLGVTAGGYLAIGVTISKSESSGLTKAVLGADATTASDRQGGLYLSALATDYNEADSTAGSGGAVAGNGAEASTDDDSQVYAGIAADTGATNILHAGAVTLQALHSSIYSGQANSVNAALVGASGSIVRNDLDADARTEIGGNVHIDATGSIWARARNEFRSNNEGESASGAAGGGLTANAAESTTQIDSHTAVVLGSGVDLDSGTDPLLQPGGIILDASTIVLASDRVQLTTGGLITGAGTNSTIDVGVSNNVNVGANAQLDSQGNISVGTYTLASVSTESRVSTWGLAGIGVAIASTSVDASENVSIGASADLTGFGNVNLLAGDDPSGLYDSVLSGNADSLAYVRGLIAMPLAYADTVLTSNAKLDIAAGATVHSGQNVTIGAYNGTLNPITNGEGHGFQLGFIPTNNGNKGDGPRKSHTAQVVNNGEVVAGFYHTLDITIPACPPANPGCTVNTLGFNADGAPFTWASIGQFDAGAFIDDNFGGAAAELIRSGVSSTPVAAMKIGTLFAAGGTVTVNADSMAGTGSLTAHGGPTITLTNNSANYLIVGNVLIPNTPGGRVQFTGAAGAADATGMTIHEEANAEGKITIHNTYKSPVGNSSFGPALFLMGDVENIGGGVYITNDTGSFGQAATIFGKEVKVVVPEGVAVIDLPYPKAYYAGGNPYSEWSRFGYWPGGIPANGVPSASQAFNEMFPTWEQVWDPDGNGSKANPQYFRYADCSGGVCYVDRIPASYSRTETAGYGSADLTGSQRSSAIYGGKVLIKAKYIDINGGITIGTDTDWSVILPESLSLPGGQIYQAELAYASGGGAAVIALTDVTAANGTSLIGVKYDVVNRRILLDDVRASSDGGSLVLDGGILSTNTLGSINVNGGLGDVSIDNRTGRAIVVQDIYAGNASASQAVVSTVDINDHFVDVSSRHRIYQYTPQDGLSVYVGAEGSTLASGMAQTSASNFYDPKAGLRWEWQQVATMVNTLPPKNDVNGTNIGSAWGNYLTCCNWSWEMPNGQPNNPWQFAIWGSNELPTGNYSITPQGHTVVNAGNNSVAFQRTLTTAYTSTLGFRADYDSSQNLYFENGQPTWLYPLKMQITSTTSVKADNRIGINFSGSAVGRVQVASNGAVSLTGTITNPGGSTKVESSSGAVTQAAGASLQTDSLVISATTGIGSDAQKIVARLSPNGLVKAVGGADGVYLDLQGGLIQEVTARKAATSQYGNVVISTLDNLAGPGTITGANVTLASTLGGVGAEADPLRVSAMGANGEGGVVNVNALHGIHLLDEATHNFLVGQIVALDGNVSIEVPNGSILNASEQTSAQALSQDQVQQVWKDLKLIRGSGADNAEARGSATAASVVAFENAMTSQYDQYWALVGDGTVVNGTFVLSTNPAVTAKYQAQASASGMTVQAYAASKYETLSRSFEENVGTNWQSQQAFQQAQQGYRFVASQAQIDALTHESGWTAEELSYSVSDVALQSRSAPVGTGTANIIGHDIRLVSGGSIGKLADPIDIALESLADGSLSTVQKAALALAKAPGDVVRLGKDAQGEFVTYQLGKLSNGDTDYASIPAGITAYGFRIAQTSPLFVDMTGALTASATDAAFIQSVRPTLTIDQVAAGGAVGLIAPENIVASALRSTTGPLISAGIDMRLTAGTGSLGTTATPLTLQVGGKLVSASAGQDAFLTSQGTLTFDRIFAEGQVVLKAGGGSLLAGAEGVAIDAHGINLAADGDIGGNTGTAQSAIIVQIADNDSLAANAGGSVNVQGAGAQFHASTITAGTDARVGADGDLRADDLESGGAAQLVAGGNLQAGTVTSGGAASIGSAGNATITALDSASTVAFDIGGNLAAVAVTSAGAASIASAGNATVAALDSGATIDFDSGGDIRIGRVESTGAANLSANGFILSTAAFNGVNITAAGITLASGAADIGAASKYLVIEDRGTTHAGAFGNIYLEQRGLSFVADELAAQNGSVGVRVTTGDATIGKITALNAVNVLLASNGKLLIEDLDPATATLGVTGAGGSIEVERAQVSRSLTASATSVRLDDVSQVGGSGPLHLVLQGANGGMASSIDASVTSANAVTIDRLAAQTASIDANVANLWIENASIASTASFSNESYTASLDNFNKVRYDSDLQVYANYPFYLRFFADPKFETNALAIDYGDNFTVNGMTSGNSVTRFIPRMLALVGITSDKDKVDDESPETGLVTWTNSALIPADAITAIEQLEVNGK